MSVVTGSILTKGWWFLQGGRETSSAPCSCVVHEILLAHKRTRSTEINKYTCGSAKFQGTHPSISYNQKADMLTLNNHITIKNCKLTNSHTLAIDFITFFVKPLAGLF